MSAIDLLTAIYKRATGALTVFAADPLSADPPSAIYHRATRPLPVFTVDPLPTIYK
ncbi:hypothetical protein [Halorubrum sp. T3]|uniref:hypothetical protein n=1 Tax=Halorubrum sp. T3 TaxID=1194088 RepID=UPI001ED987F7|nr:hypothetical protein [Halorubrum sp. T3]